MRSTLIGLLMIVAATGCRRETPDPDMVAATETTQTTATNLTTMSPTTTAITGGSVSAMQPAEKEFVIQAAFGGSAEVAKSLLAAGKATNADVTAFAQRMVTEHSRNNEELQKLATAKGLALPTALDRAHQQSVDELQNTPAPRFDRLYATQMVEDHQKMITLLESAQGSIRDPDVQAWVSRTLPVLRQHLQDARSLQAAVR